MKPRLDIVFAIPGLPFNGETVAKQSLGGSETAGYYVARELAALGHRVTVFTHGEPGIWDDVAYLPLSGFKSYASFTSHDLCVVQRSPNMFAPRLASKLNWLWCHDLALLRAEREIKGPMWNMDRILVVSDFMRKQYLDTYKLPEASLMETRNGVDLALVAKAREDLASLPVNRKRLVFAARPERGLDILLDRIMPEILKRVPDAKLALCRYENPVEHLAEFYGQCHAAALRLGEGVVEEFGSLTKHELYKLYAASGAYAYPTPSPLNPLFSEVSCISVMESMACGLPIVTSDRGALKETIGCPAGKLVAGDVSSPEYIREFVEKTVLLLTDKRAWEYASEAGLKRAKSLDWRGVAEQWSEEAERQIRERSGDIVSLARHFYRRSDIIPLKALLAGAPDNEPGLEGLRSIVGNEYAFTEDPDGYRIQYEKIGATHDARVVDWSVAESRFRVLADWLLEHKADIKTVMDYGCAHGAYATNLAKEIVHLKILGVDIDKHGVELGKTFAEKLGVTGRAFFTVATHDDLPFADMFRDPPPTAVDPDADLFDAVIAQEVLEHCPEPWKVIEALESRVRPDGWIYLTVPFGCWEYMSYHTYPHRAHLWEFDTHDFRDMLKDYEGVRIAALPECGSPLTGEPLGWWVIRYQLTEKNRALKPQPIDMNRKLWLQAPRQSVSVNIMAGPGSEEALHWCLRSIQHVADQIVVVDCGLSDEAKRIAAQYSRFGLEFVPGVDPKAAGFETPRNMGLDHCWGHWIHWIDTDEKLVQPEAVTKYLRENVFEGYSIRQHHFAVDTTFDADLPVRLFRKRSGNKWFGMIHEHPEKALNAGPGVTVVVPDVHIAHVGYLHEGGRKGRFSRNYPLLQADIKKYPERLLQKCFIMRDNMIRIGYESGLNGGRMSDEMRAMCRETIDLYKKHFLGKSYFMATDPIEYYTQALRLLGEGFEATISISAGKDSAAPNGTLLARFENEESFLIEVNKRARDLSTPLVHAYY